MTKRIQIIGLLFLSLIFFSVTVYCYYYERAMDKSGKTAVIDPIVEYKEEIITTNQMLSKNSTKQLLATMSYLDGGRKIKFKRYLSAENHKKLLRGDKLYVRYLPGEYNTEELIGDDASIINFPLNGFLISVGLLIIVFKSKEKDKPKPAAIAETPLTTLHLAAKANNSIRFKGFIKFLVSLGISAIAGTVVFFGYPQAIMFVVFPSVIALIGLAECITGLPALIIGAKINQHNLAPWQENLIWLLVFVVACGLLMVGMVLFG